jgi:hypothetical protein
MCGHVWPCVAGPAMPTFAQAHPILGVTQVYLRPKFMCAETMVGPIPLMGYDLCVSGEAHSAGGGALAPSEPYPKRFQAQAPTTSLGKAFRDAIGNAKGRAFDSTLSNKSLTDRP